MVGFLKHTRNTRKLPLAPFFNACVRVRARLPRPRHFAETKEESDAKAKIPALFLPHGQARNIIIYAHGNGCDLGVIHDEIAL